MRRKNSDQSAQPTGKTQYLTANKEITNVKVPKLDFGMASSTPSINENEEIGAVLQHLDNQSNDNIDHTTLEIEEVRYMII